MMNMNELNWGYRPFRSIDTLAVYGARTIFQNGSIEFLHDRQQFLGSEAAKNVLCKWINSKALPELKKYIREKGGLQQPKRSFHLKKGRLQWMRLRALLMATFI